jgi:hypothetical protein
MRLARAGWLVALLVVPAAVWAGGGFDQFGYNEKARIFVGRADGVDRVLDGKYWGDPAYANDHLVLKWNAEWVRGVEERWSNPPYQAWQDNEWNGRVPGGSGQVWHYKIVWVGPCGEEGDPVTGGGTCLWNEFAIVFSHGTDAGGHVFDVHARPSGYGAW